MPLHGAGVGRDRLQARRRADDDVDLRQRAPHRGAIWPTSSSGRSGVSTRRSRRLKPSSWRSSWRAARRSLRLRQACQVVVGGRDVTAMSTWAMTAVSTLLRSCAMPPAS